MLRILTLLLSVYSFFVFQAFWEINPELDGVFLEKTDVKYELYQDEEFTLDITKFLIEVQRKWYNKSLAKWKVIWWEAVETDVYTKKFASPWNKQLQLDVVDDGVLIFSKVFQIFVYEKSVPFIFDPSLSLQERQEFIAVGRNEWTLIYDLDIRSTEDFFENEISEKFEEYTNSFWEKSDYIGILGSRDFVLDIVWKINVSSLKKQVNVVIFSDFNKDFLQNYIENILSNKVYINKIFIMNATSRFFVFQNTTLQELESYLSDNKHEYKDVNILREVHPLLFVSKFVNSLSNTGISIFGIYVFLIIPFLLTLVAFFRHFVGFSTIGIFIPVWITILMFKFGSIFIPIFFVFFLLNYCLHFLFRNFNLLYAPRITLFITINILTFILFSNILASIFWIELSVESSIYLIVMAILFEKMILVITGKELNEYKKVLIYTLIISYIWYFIFSLDIVAQLVLSYPEIILLLIPVNFMIGRFTGLRITEYFRFREIIKSIEE